MKLKLESLANIAIVVVCLVAGAAIIKQNFFEKPPTAPPELVGQGEELKALKPFIPSESERTLFLVLAPKCRFCTESMPFYSRLAERRASLARKISVRVVVGKQEDIEAERDLLLESGVGLDELVSLDLRSIKVPGTPSLLLVDKEAKVLAVWFGKLSAEGETEVFDALGII